VTKDTAVRRKKKMKGILTLAINPRKSLGHGCEEY
jgi:hypothetical protein